ncbi:MAG: PAS domain-containing protein [Actinomycetota bacterium]|nr:PAS domain-containing protein [Actinomycetota bacterium]
MGEHRDPLGGPPAARPLTAEGFASLHASAKAAAIVSFDGGRFLDANSAFAELSGFERSDLLDHDVFDMGLFTDARHHIALLRELEECGEVRAWETRLRRRDGNLRDILLSAQILDVAGRRAILTRVRDVTETSGGAGVPV